MRFRSLIILTMLLLVALISVLILSVTVQVLESAARDTLEESLKRSQRVFRDLQDYRTDLFMSRVRLLSEEPRLKAVLSTQDAATILGVANEINQSLQADIFIVAMADGTILASVNDSEAEGQSISGYRLLRNLDQAGSGSDIWTTASSAYQVFAQEIRLGTERIGYLVVGYIIDDRIAETVYQQTGNVTLVTLNQDLIASPMLPQLASITWWVFMSKDWMVESLSEPVDINLGEERYMALSANYPGHSGDQELRFHMLRSLDQAFAAQRQLVWFIAGITLIGILAIFPIAALVSRRLSSPIDRLVKFTETVSEEEHSEPLEVTGPIEIRDLGSAMNAMVQDLSTSRDDLAAKERQLRINNAELEAVVSRLKESHVNESQFLHKILTGLHVSNEQLDQSLNETLDRIATSALWGCTSCGEEFDAPNPDAAPTIPCPQCGGTLQAGQVMEFIGPYALDSATLQGLQARAAALHTSIRSLLLYGEIESNNFKVEQQDSVVASIVEQVKHAARAHYAPEEFATISWPTVPPNIRVLADPKALGLALWELLDNAMRFSGGDEVTIGASIKDNTVNLSARDRGEGMNAKRLLEMQEALGSDASASQELTQLGLGLLLVKRLANLHGGRATLESVEGVGTTASIMVPVSTTDFGGVTTQPRTRIRIADGEATGETPAPGTKPATA